MVVTGVTVFVSGIFNMSYYCCDHVHKLKIRKEVSRMNNKISRKKLKKPFSCIILIIVITILSNVNVFAAESLYLNVDGVVQEKTSWCWAASSKCVIDYLGAWSPRPSQTQIVTAVKGSAVNEGANYFESHNSIHYFMVDSSDSMFPVSWVTVKDNIKGWYSPMRVTVAWKVGGAHTMVMYGYYEDQYVKNVSYMDPWGANPRWNFRTYDSFKSNSDWTWKWTNYYCKHRS